jgi:hypothetical protein
MRGNVSLFIVSNIIKWLTLPPTCFDFSSIHLNSLKSINHWYSDSYTQLHSEIYGVRSMILQSKPFHHLKLSFFSLMTVMVKNLNKMVGFFVSRWGCLLSFPQFICVSSITHIFISKKCILFLVSKISHLVSIFSDRFLVSGYQILILINVQIVDEIIFLNFCKNRLDY